MTHPDPRETDLATVADRTVAAATAVPPDTLPDDPRAYLAWLRDPARPARRPVERPRLRVVPDPAPAPRELRDPAYRAAADKLRALPDLGAASLQAARQALGNAPLEQLVIHAAANPITPPPADDSNTWPSNDPAPYAAAPACGVCGTALDPDGTCLTCTTTNGPGS